MRTLTAPFPHTLPWSEEAFGRFVPPWLDPDGSNHAVARPVGPTIFDLGSESPVGAGAETDRQDATTGGTGLTRTETDFTL